MDEPVTPPPAGRGRRRAAEPVAHGPRPVAATLAVAVPLVVLVAALLVNGDPAPAPAPAAPTEASLTSLQLTCPGVDRGSIGIATARSDVNSTVVNGTVGNGTVVNGTVAVRQGGRHQDVQVAPDKVVWLAEPDPMVVDGRRDMAPGLVATRADRRHVAAVSCHLPRPDAWFTGAGAASIHSSTLQLVNPDTGPAVADVQLLSEHGILDVRDLRGITVPGNSVLSLHLSDKAPSRSELTVHLALQRGRLGASLLDTHTERTATSDWIPPQSAPATVNAVVGVVGGVGQRTLVVANPSDDQARVDVKVIGATSTYAPEGLGELSIPPQSVVTRDLRGVLGTTATKDAVGLLVTSTQPVTAAVRSLVHGEQSSAVAAPTVTDAGLVVPEVPGSEKATLMVTAPEEAGSAAVTAYDARGHRLLDRRIAARKLTGATMALPRGTAFVRIGPVHGSLHAAVLVESGGGAVTLPMEDAVVSGLVPAVSAAW